MCFRWLKRLYHYLRRRCSRRGRGYSRDISLGGRRFCSGTFSNRHGRGSFSWDGEGSVTYSRGPPPCPGPYSCPAGVPADAGGGIVVASGSCGLTADWDIAVGPAPGPVCGSGGRSGPGYGSGGRSGPGYGSGGRSGPGYCSGAGSVPVYGSGAGSVPVYGSGAGSVPGYGSGAGSVPGYGSGAGSVPGYGSGAGSVPGYGSGAGSVPGYGSGAGSVPVYGSGAGQGEDAAPASCVGRGGGSLYHGEDLGEAEYGYRDPLPIAGVSEGSGYHGEGLGYAAGAQAEQQKCPVVVPTIKGQQCKQSPRWPPAQKK